MSLSKLSKDKVNLTRNKLILSVFIVFFYVYLFFSLLVLELRELQTTDDAYVSGNKISISSQVASSVVSINYTNTDLVKRGMYLFSLIVRMQH